MCRWQLIANTDECRCSQQRIHWLCWISASVAVFKDYLKKNYIIYRKTLWQGNVWFSVECGCLYHPCIYFWLYGSVIHIISLHFTRMSVCDVSCMNDNLSFTFKKKSQSHLFLHHGNYDRGIIVWWSEQWRCLKTCPMQHRTTISLLISSTTYQFVLQYNLEINQKCVLCSQRMLDSKSKTWKVWKYRKYIPEVL